MSPFPFSREDMFGPLLVGTLFNCALVMGFIVEAIRVGRLHGY
jgi:hypothetical protein